MHLALLLVHSAFLKNVKIASVFFLLLKAVFFLKNHTSHFYALFFSLFSLRRHIFFGSLATVRFDESEGISVQCCGGRRRHTRYAFVWGVCSGVP